MNLRGVIEDILTDIGFDGCWAYFNGAAGNTFSFFCVGDYKVHARLDALVEDGTHGADAVRSRDPEEFGDGEVYLAIHTYACPDLPDSDETSAGCGEFGLWEQITLWEEPKKPRSPFSWTFVTSSEHDFGYEGLRKVASWNRADYPWCA